MTRTRVAISALASYAVRTVAIPIIAITPFVAMTGCGAFQTRDPQTGQPTGQLDPAKVAAAQQTASTFGAIFGPIGAAVGVGIAGVIGAYAAKKKGEETGYNAGSLDAGKPLVSAGHKVP